MHRFLFLFFLRAYFFLSYSTGMNKLKLICKEEEVKYVEDTFSKGGGAEGVDFSAN